MKKLLSALLLSILLLTNFSFISCNKNEHNTPRDESKNDSLLYNSYICDMANDGIIKDMEKTWWNGIPQKISSVEAKKEISLHDVTYNCTYMQSDYGRFGSYLQNTYKNENHSIEISLDATTNKIVGVHHPDLLNDEYSLKPDVYNTAEDAFPIARDLAAQYINVSDYSVEIDTWEKYSIKRFWFVFVKKIDGFNTSEKLTVFVTSKGDICSWNLCDIGLFDNKQINIDKDILEKSVEKKLNQIYSDNYEFDYKIRQQTIAYSPEGDLVVVSQIEALLNKLHSTGVVIATVIP